MHVNCSACQSRDRLEIVRIRAQQKGPAASQSEAASSKIDGRDSTGASDLLLLAAGDGAIASCRVYSHNVIERGT